MRIFHKHLRHDKDTERKHRWITFVDGLRVELYISEERVQLPLHKEIEVSIFSDKELYTAVCNRFGNRTARDLTESEKDALEKIGIERRMLEVAGESAIIGAAQIPKDYEKTKKIRYNAFRDDNGYKFGDPYIPKSLLSEPYPERLLFLIRWIDPPDSDR